MQRNTSRFSPRWTSQPSTHSSKSTSKTQAVAHCSVGWPRKLQGWFTRRRTLIWLLRPQTSYSERRQKENLLQLDEQTFNDVFKDVPHYEVSKELLGQPAVDIFNQEGMQIFPSKSEMRKLVKGGGVSLNKEKIAAFDQPVTAADLIDDMYLLVQRGKKNYFLVIVK